MTARRLITGLAAGLLAAGLPGLSDALGRRPAKPRPAEQLSYGSWLVYWGEPESDADLARDARRLEEIDLFAYDFDAAGQLAPAQPAVTANRQRLLSLPAPRPRLLITAVNDVESPAGSKLKDPLCVHNALATPESRAAHIGQLLELARGLDGVDIDYERVDAADRAAFSAFIDALAQALHKRGQWLSVVLEPKTEGGIDWMAVSRAADQVKVMAYLYHSPGGEPGSMAPLGWIQGLAEGSLKIVPPSKLSVALHLGGIDWPAGEPGNSLEYSAAAALAAAHRQSIHLDAATASGTFQYVDGGVAHQVWIETPEGLRDKAEILRQAGVPRVDFWRLGVGAADFWRALPVARRGTKSAAQASH